MAQDISQAFSDPDTLGGLSTLAAPLASQGMDPDEVRLQQMLQRGQGPLTARASVQEPAMVSGAPVSTGPSPSAAAAGADGGAGSPAAMPPMAGSPSQPPTGSSLDDLGRGALAAEMRAGQQQMRTATAAETVNPRIQQLTDQELKDQAAAPNPNAPQYRPGFGHKVLRGLRNVALGFAEGGIPGAVFGGLDPSAVRGGVNYNAPTDAYDTALRANQGQVTQDQNELAAAKDEFQRAQDARKAAQSGEEQGAQTFGRVVTGSKSLQPPAPTFRAPVPMLVGGKPMMVTPSEHGYLSAEPGAGYGQPVSGQVLPMPEQPKAEGTSLQKGMWKGRLAYAMYNPSAPPGQRFTDPNSGTPMSDFRPEPPGSAAAGGTGIPSAGNQNLTGDAYLQSLPAELRATVKAIGEGREAPPSAGNRSKAAMAILNAVNQAYPGYRADMFPNYLKARLAFTSGTIGTAINSFNTALQHLDLLERDIPSENGTFSTVNTLMNRMAPSGSQRAIDVGRFKTDANAVSNEVQKAYKGGVVNQDEYNHMIELLDPNAAPAQIRSNIAELRQLLNGKLESYRQQWASQGPPGAPFPVPGVDTPRQSGAPAAAGAPTGPGAPGSFDWGTQAHPLAKGNQ